MLESVYQRRLIQKLRRMFPGCIILKNDSDYIQGIPDLTILWYHSWAMLEVKGSARAAQQPNQEFYVHEAHNLSFASFIYPEIEEVVLGELQKAFGHRRAARLSQRE